jgi:hypothetical protein
VSSIAAPRLTLCPTYCCFAPCPHSPACCLAWSAWPAVPIIPGRSHVFDVFEEDGSLHAIGRVRCHAASICYRALSRHRWHACFGMQTALSLASSLILLPSLPFPLLARRCERCRASLG